MSGSKRPSSGVRPEDSATARRPTVVVPPARPGNGNSKSLASTIADPLTRPVQKPTKIMGVERKRIEVSDSELRKLSPGISDNACDKALKLIATFVAEKASERQAVLWGHDLQSSYSALMSQTLALAQSPILVRTQGYLDRMIDILGSIDLMEVCGHGQGSILGQLTKSVNKRVDTPDELRAAQAELDLLVGHMTNAMKELLDLKDRLETHSSRIDEIGAEVEAFALAALFLSHHLRLDKAGIAGRFEERSMSLTQTLAQIRENDPVKQVQIGQPIHMISSIQNVALVMMPRFIGSIAAVVTMVKRKGVSPTEAGEVIYQLQDIVNKLK